MSSSPRTKRKPRPASGPRKVTSQKRSGSARAKLTREKDFSVRFWGVRGSIPSPGPATSRYGGNTPCVEIRCGEQLLIFDLGSGVRMLGDHYGSPLAATIFLSHYHYDHLQGLPFFGPIFDPRSQFALFGPSRDGVSVRDVLGGQMQKPYFPVTADAVFRAQLEYRGIEAGQRVELGEVAVSSVNLNHPGGNLGYRVDYHGRSVVYATDLEHGSPMDEPTAAFARGADVLIYDAMYTDEEYEGRRGPARVGWGHSTWSGAVDAAIRSKAKKLVLFHHEPTRGDDELDRVLRQVRKQRPDAVAARESMILYV